MRRVVSSELARIEAAAKERSAADRGESRNELLTKVSNG